MSSGDGLSIPEPLSQGTGNDKAQSSTETNNIPTQPECHPLDPLDDRLANMTSDQIYKKMVVEQEHFRQEARDAKDPVEQRKKDLDLVHWGVWMVDFQRTVKKNPAYFDLSAILLRSDEFSQVVEPFLSLTYTYANSDLEEKVQIALDAIAEGAQHQRWLRESYAEYVTASQGRSTEDRDPDLHAEMIGRPILADKLEEETIDELHQWFNRSLDESQRD